MAIKGKTKSIVSFLFPSVIAVIIAIILFRVILGITYVPSSSMLNTIPVNSIAIMVRARFWPTDYKRGDIIVFRPSAENSDVVKENNMLKVKRIVGIAGDTVEIKGGVTYVNGEIYDEPWLAETPKNEDFGPYTVGDDMVFVMGDNRNHSVDSRYWVDPYVDTDAIIGKVIYVVK